MGFSTEISFDGLLTCTNVPETSLEHVHYNKYLGGEEGAKKQTKMYSSFQFLNIFFALKSKWVEDFQVITDISSWGRFEALDFLVFLAPYYIGIFYHSFLTLLFELSIGGIP